MINSRFFGGRRSALGGLLFIVLAGCASKPKVPMVPPDWTTLPSAIVDSFCGKLRGEGMASDAPMALVATTQPLISGTSLRSMAHLYGKDAELSAAAQVLTASLQPLPIDVASARNCAWLPIQKIDPVRHIDIMVVELSAPFVNPFAKNEAGLFGRFSLGGRESQWYWIPLAQRNGIWAIGNVFALDMHE